MKAFCIAALGVLGALLPLVTLAPTADAAPAGPAASAAPSPRPTETPPPPPFTHLRWREVGPAAGGGRVTSVVGSARNPNLYYLGAAAGGVWKSRNGGATWTPVFDKEHVSSIGAIAIDPTNDETVWVGTGETNPRNDVTYGGGMYKTTDGGRTWTLLGLEDTLQISSIAIDPHNPNTVIVGAMGDLFADSKARGIYRTTDGGRTWTQTLYVGPRSGISDLAMDPKNSHILYAGVWEFRRQPWTFQSGGNDDGLYKSTDGGISWSKLTGHGLPDSPTGRIGLAIAPSDPNRIYALIESSAGVLWRSDDRGANWLLVTKDTLADQRPFYFTHLAVDPQKPDHVYAVSEMLAESKDGGKTFKEIADEVHVDYHAMWIAPNDPTRMIVGEDGGYALTLDDGAHWSFSRNIPIGQVYHVGYNDETPYRVCAPLQDNNAFCGPSNALDPEGLPNAAWERVIGGDGMWAWPDPQDPNLVWTDLQDGRLSIYDRKAQRNRFVSPYIGPSAEQFDLTKARYRFNWNSPIAFSPWDPGTVWYGGDVVFQTRDKGMNWKPISPDLTKNDKAHQAPSGGPITHDVSGAEYTDTILDIEASPLRRGEIWVGTDDGIVQVTRDDGTHWHQVTPPGVPPDGRFENTAPSPVVPGLAYAVYDRHEVGDRNPYVFVTQNWGATWKPIDAGLPSHQPARSIRPDPHNANVVYLGLERSVWISWDRGNTWHGLQMNLPIAPIYDIRVQPRWNDLWVATHGRALWAIDSVTSLQNIPAAQGAGAMLFAPRPAYEFSLHSDDEGLYTRFAGQNPPNGTIVDFYQTKAQPSAPALEILDRSGHVVRHISGSHPLNGKQVPYVTNDPGINRFIWNFRTDGPILWMGAAREEYRGPREGVQVVPGRYAVRTTLNGRTFTQSFEVRADPRLHLSQAQIQEAHDFFAHGLSEYSQVNAALNRLDGVITSGTHAVDDAKKKNDTALLGQLTSTIDGAKALRGKLTADYHNDEDSIQRPGSLREDLEIFSRGFVSGLPNSAFREYAERVSATFRSMMREVNAFFGGPVKQTNGALQAAGLSPLVDTPNPPEPSPSPSPKD